MAVAFFDLDKTLLAVNSGSLWIRRELELGHMTHRQALRASLWLARYHLGFASLQEVLQQTMSHLQGTGQRHMRERTVLFYEEVIRWQFRPGALRAVEEHRQAGDKLVLLTSASGYLSDLVARDLRFDAILCNRFEVDAGGLHTGRFLGEVCFGEGKRVCARAFASEARVPLSACTFYTDSYSDVSVMEVVGRPVAVHPDRRLRREALRRGWAVVDWGLPSGDVAPS
jgi:HAD superfamily hydrolase (TIGR01490 family)